jgi:DNA-directed RNA polymerase II subunit RPB7
MDGVVTSVLRTGFFVDCGSLQAFVGRNVGFAARYMQVPVH